MRMAWSAPREQVKSSLGETSLSTDWSDGERKDGEREGVRHTDKEDNNY